MELRELTRSVYACLQEDRGLGCSNSGLVVRGGGLVVDTFWDLPHTRELVRQYARVWKEAARRVVNTHANGDHCWGNQLFPDAEIIAHSRCAEEFDHENPAMLEQLRNATAVEDPALASLARKLSGWDFRGIELKKPTRLIDDRLTLELEDVVVELLYVGPAHTGGDVIVHLPGERVLFSGDVLFRRCTPIGWQGTYDKWIAALDLMITLAPETIVPGHGPLCGVEGPKEMKAYLEYVRAESKRFFEQGLSALEAAKRIDLGPYAGWTEPARLIFNVERAYRELRGEPYDAPIDAVALFREMYELEIAKG